jgi:hypothetical protein
MTPEEGSAMMMTTLAAIAEAGRSYPLERRQEAARRLLARAAEVDGTASAEAFRSAAETLLRP